MHRMLAVVWHFWIAAIALVPITILAIVVMAGFYLRNVESTRYPKGR
jgi:hypothetical protein